MNELMLAFHHLVVDNHSMSVLLDTLDGYCADLLASREPKIASPATPYWQWLRSLESAGERGVFRNEFAFWSRQVDDRSN